MKHYLHMQKFILVLMILVLLIQLSGCVSYRIIPSSDLPDPSRYHYTIYIQNLKFPLENAIVSNEILSGKVNFKHSYRRNVVKVYVSSDSMIKLDTQNTISIPLNRIAKVEKAENGIEKNPSLPKVRAPKTPAKTVALGFVYVILTTITVSALIDIFNK